MTSEPFETDVPVGHEVAARQAAEGETAPLTRSRPRGTRRSSR